MENIPQQAAPASNVAEQAAAAGRLLKASDIVMILAIGEVFAWLLMVVRRGVGIAVPQAVMYSLPIILPLGALFCLWALSLLGKKRPMFFQLGKYAAIGFFNTALDFAIFNFLVMATRIEPKGPGAGFLTSISFIVAVANSYLLNKYWTFRSRGPAKAGEFVQFIIVSLVALLLVSGFLTLMTKYVEPPYGLSIQQWANAVKAISIFISLAWNFAGYKFIVFREKKTV